MLWYHSYLSLTEKHPLFVQLPWLKQGYPDRFGWYEACPDRLERYGSIMKGEKVFVEGIKAADREKETPWM